MSTKKGGCCLGRILFFLLIATGVFYILGEYFDYGGGGGGGNVPLKSDNPFLKDEYLSTPEKVIEPTPENSPGNPRFIDVSFTEEEIRNSPAVAGEINPDTAAILFSGLDVMVNVRGYNLHNPSDTLVVQTLPVKTDPTYGHELHTYNIFLTSGQDKFGTEVEVTLPIHNGPGSLRNVLWLNEKTGKWEEVFYTVADDGKSCTAYVDHFSPFSCEESTDNREQFYYDVTKYLKGSVFVEYDPSGIAPQAMKKVGVIQTDAFAKFLRKTSKNSENVYELLRRGDLVPTDSKSTEAIDMLDDGSNLSSSIVTVTNEMKLLSDAVGNKFNVAFTVLGGWILYQRLKDTTMRGITPLKVVEENRWSIYWTLVSTIGTGASIAGATFLASTCSWACLINFAATKVYTENQKFIKKECPYGTPVTIEEGAYHEYMYFNNDGPLRKLGIKSNVPLNGFGKGWAEAINAIRDANPNATSIDDVSEQIKQLYEEYVNYFWADLPDDQKLRYWRSYLKKATVDICKYCNDLNARIPDPNTGEYLFDKVPNLPSDFDEYRRLFDIVCMKAKVIRLNNDGRMSPIYNVINLSDFNSVSGEARFNDRYVLAQRIEYKHRAMEALMHQTNHVILDIIEKDFHKLAMEVRTKIREEVLPTLNTTLYFYAVDESLKKDETVLHSKYYGYDSVSMKNDPNLLCEMKFKGRRTPLFRAKNDTGAPYCLDLKTSDKDEKVGKSTVFHYLQYGAPDSVDIKAPNYGNLKDLVGYVQLAKAKPYEVTVGNGTERGFRVPVSFNNNSFDLSQFNGVWVPLELKGKFTEDDYVTIIVYLPEDNELGIYENPLRYRKGKSGWSEIKYFSFDEKTKTISIDFEKNAREGQKMRSGIALYTLKDNGNLMMRNSAGGWEFFRLTEEDLNSTNTIPIRVNTDIRMIPLGDTETE